MMNIQCEVSLGELVDKISILKIKSEKISEPVKLAHVHKELQSLMSTLNDLRLSGVDTHLASMVDVNLKLWVIEDDIRYKERAKVFDAEFIELARQVYITNDERFRRKNLINSAYHSGLVEVKSYQEY